jgi:hypothetical protein
VPLIDDFIARYRKEYDFYDQAARLVAQALEANLQAAGIRSKSYVPSQGSRAIRSQSSPARRRPT